jgi:dCTP deaminase
MQLGVLSSDQYQNMAQEGRLTLPPETKFDPSSFDLTISDEAWSAEFAFRLRNQHIDTILDDLTHMEPEGGGFTFERNRAYFVRLREKLALGKEISGHASGRSSVGRIDCMTRLLTDKPLEYDVVPAEYVGPLYVLLVPQSFSVRAPVGASFNQLRLINGPHHRSIISRSDAAYLHEPLWYVKEGAQFQSLDYQDYQALAADLAAPPGFFDLTVELADETFIYKARNGTDLTVDISAAEGVHPAEEYWERVNILQTAPKSVQLEPRSFYLLKSKERLSLAHEVAVDVLAISETLGDIRIHYAGFAHPGFGRARDDGRLGTPLIFEVRSNDIRTRLYDGTPLAKVAFFRMSAPPSEIAPSHYNEQELQLAKWFAPVY